MRTLFIMTVAAILAAFFLCAPQAEGAVIGPDYLNVRYQPVTTDTIENLALWFSYAPVEDFDDAHLNDSIDMEWYNDGITAPSYCAMAAARVRVNTTARAITKSYFEIGELVGKNRTTQIVSHTLSAAFRTEVYFSTSGGDGTGSGMFTGMPLCQIPLAAGGITNGQYDSVYLLMSHENVDMTNNTYTFSWTWTLYTSDNKKCVVSKTETLDGTNASYGFMPPANNGGAITTVGFQNISRSSTYGRFYELKNTTWQSWAYSWEDPANDVIDFKLYRNMTYSLKFGARWFTTQAFGNRWTFYFRNATTNALVNMIEYDFGRKDIKVGMADISNDIAQYYKVEWMPPTEADYGLINPYATMGGQEGVWLLQEGHPLILDLSAFQDGKYYVTVVASYYDAVTGINMLVPYQTNNEAYFEVISTSTAPANTTNNTQPPVTNATQPGLLASSWAKLNTFVGKYPATPAVIAVALGAFLFLGRGMSRRKFPF